VSGEIPQRVLPHGAEPILTLIRNEAHDDVLSLEGDGVQLVSDTRLSYPHFGPKNTRLNFLSISDTFSMCFADYYCASTTYVIISAFKFISQFFLAFYSKFLQKIIQKGILVISYKGTHFGPYNLSLSLFNLFA